LTALTVSGAITVTGNVDGRDVAADGTKLDGIEAAATADQSSGEIEAMGFPNLTITISTSSASGGSDGDVWFKY